MLLPKISFPSQIQRLLYYFLCELNLFVLLKMMENMRKMFVRVRIISSSITGAYSECNQRGKWE